MPVTHINRITADSLLVQKLESPTIDSLMVHKTERGLSELNTSNEREARLNIILSYTHVKSNNQLVATSREVGSDGATSTRARGNHG